jgi:hypothetical protein
MDMLVRKHPMPEIAAFIADLRDAFGEAVDEAIARGKAGQPGFYAVENGRTIGTKPVDDFNRWVADDSVVDRHYCKGCDGQCVGTEARCSQRR